MSDSGWIKLHRQLQRCELWTGNEAFDARSAWIDLLLNVSHQQANILDRGTVYEVQPGQILTSFRSLGERWHWSRTKVKNFFELLTRLEMVTLKVTQRNVMVTLVKWEFYQGEVPQKMPLKCHRSATEMPLLSNNKNDKNDKKINNPPISPLLTKTRYADFVEMTESEHEKLTAEFGVQGTAEIIEILNNYKGSSGKTYKSDYLAIRNWVIKRWKEERSQGRYRQPNDVNRAFEELIRMDI